MLLCLAHQGYRCHQFDLRGPPPCSQESGFVFRRVEVEAVFLPAEVVGFLLGVEEVEEFRREAVVEVVVSPQEGAQEFLVPTQR